MFDLVLRYLVLEVVNNPSLLRLDVLALFLLVFLFCLLGEGYRLVIALLSNELNQLLVVLFRLVVVHE